MDATRGHNLIVKVQKYGSIGEGLQRREIKKKMLGLKLVQIVTKFFIKVKNEMNKID